MTIQQPSVYKRNMLKLFSSFIFLIICSLLFWGSSIAESQNPNPTKQSLFDIINQLVSENPAAVFVGWVLGAVGWLVGMFSGTISLISIVKDRKYEQGKQLFLHRLQSDWETKYTEEQRNILKTELQNLQQQIDKDIPNKAKRAWLENQQSYLTESISSLYQQYSKCKQELGETESANLSPVIEQSIRDQLMPVRKKQIRDQKIIIALVILLTCFTAFPFILETAGFMLRGYVSYENAYLNMIGIVFATVLGVLSAKFLFRKRIISTRMLRWTGILFLLLWISLTIFVVIGNYPYKYEVPFACFALLPLAGGSAFLRRSFL